jgi:hypothetical protein
MTDLSAKHWEMNRPTMLAAEARTIRGPGPDGPRPGCRSGSLSAYVLTVRAWGLDGP